MLYSLTAKLILFATFHSLHFLGGGPVLFIHPVLRTPLKRGILDVDVVLLDVVFVLFIHPVLRTPLKRGIFDVDVLLLDVV